MAFHSTATRSRGHPDGVDRRWPHQISHPPRAGLFGRLRTAAASAADVVEDAPVSVDCVHRRSSSRRARLIG